MKLSSIAAIFVCTTFVLRGGDTKQEVISDSMSRIEQLVRLAKQEASANGDEQYKRSIQAKVKPLLESMSPEELGKVAVVSLAFYYPGNAEDVSYDQVFYSAFWECVDRLCQKGTKENYQALLFIQERAALRGGEKIQFEAVLKDFEAKMK